MQVSAGAGSTPGAPDTLRRGGNWSNQPDSSRSQRSAALVRLATKGRLVDTSLRCMKDTTLQHADITAAPRPIDAEFEG